MKFGLTLLAACVINLLLFWFMIQMVTAEQDRKWIATTDAQFFDFVRPRPKQEAVPRARKAAPPEPQPPVSLSEPLPQPVAPTEDLRALPLPVPALKIDLPSMRPHMAAGPSLPAVVGSGRSKTGALASIPGTGMGVPSAPAFIMADELTAIARSQPAYPEPLRLRRVEGEVLVEFIVDKEGKVNDPIVINSSPAGAFDRVAVRAVRSWRFQPRRDDQGNPVDVRVRQVFTFSLNR